MVEQRMSNVSTGRLYIWSNFRHFMNKLLQTICIFSCVFGSSGFCPWCQILLCWCSMFSRPTLPNCKASSSL